MRGCRRCFQILPAVLGLLAAPAALPQNWTQWGMNPQHTGAARVAGQRPERILAELTFDPFARQAQNEAGGTLLAHYQPPLTNGRDLFVSSKAGRYISCDPPGSRRPFPCAFDAWNEQIWGIERFAWRGDRLVQRWWVESDWKPVPDAGGFLGGWEPVFHTAIAGRFVYVPAGGGEVLRLRRSNGQLDRRFRPFGPETDPRKFVVGPITADDRGTIYYNVLQLEETDPWRRDVPGAWLVKITRRGEITIADYRTLVPDAPVNCKGTFAGQPLPWPPSPAATPPSAPCLSQRPGVNVAPAIAKDGTIYTVSRGHSQTGQHYSYLIALHPDLTLKWAASLRGRLRNGCGVLLPIGGANGCRAGTPANGVDPTTNDAPAGVVSDLSTSSPVVAPDGSVLYGAVTRFNYLRGQLFHFDAQGNFLNAHDFGWDTTPAIWDHDGTYSIVIKENNYPVGSYCSDFSLCPARSNGPYYITQLDANLRVEWRFRNENTQKCSRREDGSLDCVPAVPGGFEWCINAPAVDAKGNVYANSEDGNLYVIGQGGSEVGRIFLNLALGAAYTPLSIGIDGKIYTENDGKVFVVGER